VSGNSIYKSVFPVCLSGRCARQAIAARPLGKPRRVPLDVTEDQSVVGGRRNYCLDIFGAEQCYFLLQK